MQAQKPITPSSEDYLKTICLLQKESGAARLNDIACRMGVSKPSANHAVNQLAEKKLVEHQRFGPVRLTEKGMESAEALLAKYELIRRFYLHVLHVSEDTAHAEACAIEHTVQEETLRQMATLL